MSFRGTSMMLPAMWALACSGEDDSFRPPEPQACPPPARLVGEACRAPGVQDNGCPAGTLASDGECVPAGVPPEMCAAGFEPVDGGCSPILPAMPCGDGMLAVPGDTACYEPVDCGQGQWGNIPIEAGTIFVDGAYAQGDSDGSADKPFVTLTDAITAGTEGSFLAIAAGSYAGVGLIAKRMRIWGRCPRLVEIVSAVPTQAAVGLFADGSELHGVSLSGFVGARVFGAKDVVLDGLWAHDTGYVGILVEEDGSAGVSRSIVERARAGGLAVEGSDAVFDGVVSRHNLPFDSLGGDGLVAHVGVTSGIAANVSVQRSVLEGNRDVGMFVRASNARVEASVVRGTLADSQGRHGRGFQVESDQGTRGKLEIRSSLIEANLNAGIYVLGADATVEATSIRGTRPSSGYYGCGAAAWPEQTTAVGPTLAMRWVLVDDSVSHALMLAGADATLAGVLVRNTQPSMYENDGRGMTIQSDPPTALRSFVDLEGVAVMNSYVAGIVLHTSDAVAGGVLVENAAAAVSDGAFGDAIAGVQSGEPFWLQLSGSVMRTPARAGLAVFGGAAEISSSSIACAPIDMALDKGSGGEPPAIIDRGGNECACDAEKPCRALPTGLTPPAPLGPD